MRAPPAAEHANGGPVRECNDDDRFCVRLIGSFAAAACVLTQDNAQGGTGYCAGHGRVHPGSRLCRSLTLRSG